MMERKLDFNTVGHLNCNLPVPTVIVQSKGDRRLPERVDKLVHVRD